MSYIKYNLTQFHYSIPDINYLPKCQGIEIAFIGRTNTGKSSLLNVLTNNKNISKTSKTPGSTKYINFFKIPYNIFLVDFPGYGYSQKIKKNWITNIIKYLKNRQCLKGLILLIDIRRSIKTYDELIIKNAINNNLSILLLLTKADKINFINSKNILNKHKKFFNKFKNIVEIELFSTKKPIGLKKIKNKINYWYKLNKSFI